MLVAAARRLLWWPVIKLADVVFGKPDLTDLTLPRTTSKRSP